MEMRSATLKLISVACASIVVLTIFQVAVTNVSAADPMDSDLDGLLDRDEHVTRSWMTDVWHEIGDHWNMDGFVTVRMDLPALDRVTSVKVLWKVLHPQSSDIRVHVSKLQSDWICMGVGISGTPFEGSFELLGNGYTAADFAVAQTWELYALDYDDDGIAGTLMYFRIEVTRSTDPLDPDTDNDGLSDGDEVNSRLMTQTWTSGPHSIGDMWSQDGLVAVRFSLPALDHVTSAKVYWDISHPQSNDLKVFAQMSTNDWTEMGYGPSGTSFKGSYELLAHQYDQSDFETAHSWNFYILDYDGDGLSGILNSLRLEVVRTTDPLRPDTDGDGILDGNEVWSQTWSTEEFYHITHRTQGYPYGYTEISLTIPAGLPSDLTAAWLQVGIVHPDRSLLKISIKRNGGGETTLWDQEGGSTANLFNGWNLFESGYGFSPSDLGSISTWTLRIWNYAGWDGQQAHLHQLQYLRIQVSGETNPLNPDTDGDGILDGEEVNLGEDGWITNPVLRDTDSDGVSDFDEINKNTLCGEELDPTSKDTDGDGFDDSIDRALGDRMLEITIDSLYLEDILGGKSSPSVFFIIEANGNTYCTERRTAQVGQTRDMNLHYFVDIRDSDRSADFLIRAYADNIGSSDPQLDIAYGSSMDVYCTWNDDALAWIFDRSGRGDGYNEDRNAEIRFTIEAVVPERSNVVLVTGIQDGEEYGLVETDNGYRYNADEQVYVLYIDFINPVPFGSPFVRGTNTVIIPRSVAVASDLGYYLEHPDELAPWDVLRGADFAVPDGYFDSSHIAATISKNLIQTSSAYELNEILTKDHDGNIIGNTVRISPEDLYLLHLPSGVLSSIPFVNIRNSGLGEAPVNMPGAPGGLWGTVITICDFVYHGLVAVANFIVDVAEAVYNGIRDFVGMVGDTAGGVMEKIVKAVEKIKNAFDAFVTWAKEFMADVINLAFAGINAIWDAILDYARGLLRILSDNDIEGVGSAMSSYIFNNPVFVTLLSVSITLDIVMLTLSPVISPFAFLLVLIAPMVISAIIGSVTVEPGDESLRQEARDVGEDLSRSTDSTLVAQTASQFLTDEEAHSTEPNYGGMLLATSLALWLLGQKPGQAKDGAALLYSITALAMEQIFYEQEDGTPEKAYAMILMVTAAGTAPILAWQSFYVPPGPNAYKVIVFGVAITSFTYTFYTAIERVDGWG